ncbi:MAG: metallophosphoesterase, partial [Opitutales bacterium]
MTVASALAVVSALGAGPVRAGGSADAARSAATTSFSFGAAGDYGYNNRATAVFQAMGASNLNFALGLGDFSMSQITPESAWCSYVKSSIGSLPFELVSGNHEDGGEVAEGLIWNFAKCMPNQMTRASGTYGEQYYFDYPATKPIARFIMISPGLKFSNGDSYDYSAGGAAYQWVSKAIDSARAAGIRWIVVGNHKTCLTAGGSACDGGTAILNLLIFKRVDLILMGHDHIYQRSQQLALGPRCSGLDPSAYNAGCVANDGSTGAYAAGAGTVINGLGTGGDGPGFAYVWTRDDTPYFVRYAGYNLNVRRGFEKFTVTPQAITAQFVGVNPVGGPTSSFADSYTITTAPLPAEPPQPVNPDGSIFENGLDGQAAGAPAVDQVANRFTLVGTDTHDSDGMPLNDPVVVQTATAASAPNAAAIDVTGGGGGYLYTQYQGPGYLAHTLRFKLELGPDFALSPGGYLVLAETQPDGAKLVLTPGGGLLLDYVDSAGAQHFIY